MPIVDFNPDNIPADIAGKKRVGIDKEQLAKVVRGMAAVNRRYWIVGRFNAQPEAKKLYFFGSNARGELLEKLEGLGDDLAVVSNHTEQGFYDGVRPLVAERLVQVEGESVVIAGAPGVREGVGVVDEATLHEVNSFLLLFGGYQDAGGERDETLLGRSLLKRLEGDLDAYLDLQAATDELIKEFNAFIPANNRATDAQLLAGAGIVFHDNFAELLFEYLIRESQAAEFDGARLDWASFEKRRGSVWSEKARAAFAKSVVDFKKALVFDPPTSPNTLNGEFRKTFADRRKRVLAAGKTVHTKLILSLLPLWAFRTLIGRKPDDLNEQVHIAPVCEAINGDMAEDRRFKLDGMQAAITLAEPMRVLSQDNRERLREKLEQRVADVVDAWANNDDEAKKRLTEGLRVAGLDAKQLERTLKGLEVVTQIAEMRAVAAAARNADPAEARSEAAGVLRRAWLGSLRGQYLNVLVGNPVTTLGDVKSAVVADYQQLYIMAELLKDEVGTELLKKARAGKEYLSKQNDGEGGVTGGLEAVLPRLSAGYLLPVAGAMNADLLHNLEALGAYAKIRADKLAADTAAETRDHSQASSGDRNMRQAVAKVTESEVVKAVEEEEEREVVVEADQAEITSEAGSDSSVAATGNVAAPIGPSAPAAKKASRSAPRDSSAAATGNAAAPIGPSAPAATGGESPAAKKASRSALRDLLARSAARAPATVPPAGPAIRSKPSAPAAPTPSATPERKMLDSAETALSLIRKTRANTNSTPEFKRLCRRVAMGELLLLKNGELKNFGRDMSSLYQMTLDMLGCGSDDLSQFFCDHSLTEYFVIDTPGKLYETYRRLQLQSCEAASAMAQYISEVRGTAELVGKAATKFLTDAELFLFNGTGDQFVEWLEATRAANGGQFWDPQFLSEEKFLRPSLVYILENALPNGLEPFLNRLKAFVENKTAAHKLLLPTILCSTTLTASDQWHAAMSSGIKDLPFPFYFVGPARPVTPHSPLGRITRPAGLSLLESLITGKTDGESSTKSDPSNVVLPPLIVSLSRVIEPVDAAVRKLIVEGRIDFAGHTETPALPPMRASMWLTQVQLLYAYLQPGGPASNALQGSGGDAFRECFAQLDKISTGAFGTRQKRRAALQDALNVTFDKDFDDALYSVRIQNGNFEVAVLTDPPGNSPSAERYFPTPWFRF